jgi:hypothetical protein
LLGFPGFYPYYADHHCKTEIENYRNSKNLTQTQSCYALNCDLYKEKLDLIKNEVPFLEWNPAIRASHPIPGCFEWDVDLNRNDVHLESAKFKARVDARKNVRVIITLYLLTLASSIVTFLAAFGFVVEVHPNSWSFVSTHRSNSIQLVHDLDHDLPICILIHSST